VPVSATDLSLDASNSSRQRYEQQAVTHTFTHETYSAIYRPYTWLGSRVVSVLDSGSEGHGFKSQSRRCRVTVLGKLFTPIVPLFTKQQNW